MGGKCSKGDDCTFAHEPRLRRCADFSVTQFYWRGTKCGFLHQDQELGLVSTKGSRKLGMVAPHKVATKELAPIPLGDAPGPAASRWHFTKQSFCKYFKQGKCTLGDSCEYSHEKFHSQRLAMEVEC